MHMKLALADLAFLALLLLASPGCSERATQEATFGSVLPAGLPAIQSPASDEPAAFEEQWLQIAGSYRDVYLPVDANFHWAPAMCAAPPSDVPQLFVSSSDDSRTHGRKRVTAYYQRRDMLASYHALYAALAKSPALAAPHTGAPGNP